MLDVLRWRVNTRNLQRGQGLSMPLLAAIALPPPMLEDNDFFAPLLGRNLGFDPHASNGRHANCHLCALPNEVHIGQCDYVANGPREFFYINPVAWTHSILPTTRRHNRIHILSFAQLYLILRGAIIGGIVSDQALAKLYKEWVVTYHIQRRTVKPAASRRHVTTAPGARSATACIVLSTGRITTAYTSSRDEATIAIMVLFRDTRRFEITVEEQANLWVAKLRAFVPGRLYPTLYLLQTYTTRQEAIEALKRKWRILFPDEEALAWHDPVPVSLPSPPRRPRHSDGREG